MLLLPRQLSGRQGAPSTTRSAVKAFLSHCGLGRRTHRAGMQGSEQIAVLVMQSAEGTGTLSPGAGT